MQLLVRPEPRDWHLSLLKKGVGVGLRHFVWFPRTGGDRIVPFRREMYGTLLDHVRVRAWDRVLAVQNRGGWAAEELFRRLVRGYVCGLDVDQAATESATRRRGISGQLEFLIWDGKRFPFPEKSFDSVFSTFALDRFAAPLKVLSEMRRVLRPGGHLYLLEPDRSSFSGLYSLWDLCFRLIDRGHIRYYSALELLRLVRQAGFVEERELYRSERLLSGGKILATAMVVQAQRGG